MNTQQATATEIDAAIVKALKSSEAARAAYAKVKEACATTEAQERIAKDDAEIQTFWKAESESFKSADDAAQAARQAGMEAAPFAMHPALGRDAAAAAVRAFQAAAEWE